MTSPATTITVNIKFPGASQLVIVEFGVNQLIRRAVDLCRTCRPGQAGRLLRKTSVFLKEFLAGTGSFRSCLCSLGVVGVDETVCVQLVGKWFRFKVAAIRLAASSSRHIFQLAES